MPDESGNASGTGETIVDLARTLSDVARSLQPHSDLQGTLNGIVKAVTETVPGAQDAGVSLREGKALRTVAASSDLVRRLNDLEHELQEGPCIQAELEQRVFRTDDMARETRWPRFAAAATEAGIRSMLGFRLFVTGRTLGALDLYSSKPDAFDTDAERVGELFAAHAAIAMMGSSEHAQWKTALSSRDVIGMAEGILMLRENLTDEDAFTLMITTSQKANIKIHDLAKWLVDTANDDAGQRSSGPR